MRTKMSVSLVVLLFSFFNFSTAKAQEVGIRAQRGHFFSLSSRLSNGIYLAFANETEPPGAIKFSSSLIETDGKGIIHRVFGGEEEGFFFGYDLKAEPVPDTRQIRILIMPLSAEYEQRLRARATFQARSLHPDFKSPSLFQTQAAQLVNDGDSLHVDLLVNQKTGVKIVEIIRASFEEIALGDDSSRARTPRDFSLDDVELKVINYRLIVNGELIAGGGACAGPIIWFYLPGRGRFIFSIKPHEGYDFQKIGAVENNKISFTIGEDRYQWISSSPVVRVNGKFNLWVLHDSDYHPDEVLMAEMKKGDAIIGAVGTNGIKNLLPKK